MSDETHTILDHVASRVAEMRRTTDLVVSFCQPRRSYQLAMHGRLQPAGPRFPEHRTIRPGVGRTIPEAALWFRTVAPLAVAAEYGDDEPEERKTLMWACRLLGLSWGDVHKAINDCRTFGDATAALAWARFMSPLDERYVGFIYSAQATGERGVTKIGFSTRPEKRMKELSRIYGVEIRLVRTLPGTILHEWTLHQNTPSSVASEWYRTDAVPSWLAGSVSEAEAA